MFTIRKGNDEMTIRIGIAGYGNLGRGVESAIIQNTDMELVGIFTRRNPEDVKIASKDVQVYKIEDILEYKDQIDVLILCGGSKDDLPVQGPQLAASFNTIDSFDTHAKIPDYFESVDAAAKPNEKTAIISVGWDPGLFSINRLYGEAVLPVGETYTFWGKGLSQGHSDALRRIEGVKDAVQYTIPVDEAVNQVRSGTRPTLTTRQKHTRECYVVLENGVDETSIKEAIVTMPDYFIDYDTTVHFITEQQLKTDHAAMPHGGFIIRSGKSGTNNSQVMEYSLKLKSNPEFTSSVLVAYARAAYKMSKSGQYGAKTVFDIAPGLLSPKSDHELRKELL